jgi:hypothetical protein
MERKTWKKPGKDLEFCSSKSVGTLVSAEGGRYIITMDSVSFCPNLGPIIGPIPNGKKDVFFPITDPKFPIAS